MYFKKIGMRQKWNSSTQLPSTIDDCKDKADVASLF